jgi:dUTP pyrophosphatase
MVNIEYMQQQMLRIVDPNDSYSEEDFNKEFSGPLANTDDFKIKINFKNESNNPDPEYATSGSSGFDIRANLTEPIEIEGRLKGNNIKIIPTGLFFELSDGFEIQIRPRSGLAAKNGVTVLNTPGTIDADYRGEIKIILINHSNETFTVHHGDRIAQGVISSVMGKKVLILNKVKEINENTERASGGFGSTGVK